MDIYKIKVYHGSTNVFANATYLQDTFIGINFTPPASTGNLVNSDTSLTALGQQYTDDGYFSIPMPFLYNSDFDNSVMFARGMSFFPYYQACGIDVKTFITTYPTMFYVFLTTDASEYYVRLTCYRDNRSNDVSIWVDSGGRLMKKSDNTAVSDYTKTCSIMGLRTYSIGQNFPSYVVLSTDNLDFTINTYTGVIVKSDATSYTGWSTMLANDTPYVENPDPYADAGDSTTGGGDGKFDGTGDDVPIPGLPSVGATNTGFISLFVPSQSQLQSVANYLWSNLFDLATFKKIFEDPMDCILGLSVVPVSIPTSGSAAITVGNIELSGITLPLASQQYVEVDCGSIDFSDASSRYPYFGSYLDFEPYTKMSIFIPYSGVHAVSADDIMGKVVSLKYHIDILTGSLVAFLLCGSSVLYEFNGACASNIPVNSLNYASTIENAIRIAVNIGTTVATAGAAAPLTGASEAGAAAKGFGTALAIGGSTAEGALSLKPSIDRAGSLGGTTGLMGNQTPYFIITRPRLCKPANQDFFKGYPSFIQVVLGDLDGKGYTEFDIVILASLYLTDDEKKELNSILQTGVYL